MSRYTPQEQPQATMTARRRLTIGIPTPTHDRRLPLTPEAAEIITEYGIEVRIQRGAGALINYPDTRYAAAGARIVERAEALECDIVISCEMPRHDDIAKMRHGALLMTLYAQTHDAKIVKALLQRHVSAIALTRIADRNRRTPVADTLGEIAGRAAVTIAAARLAQVDAATNVGKGILIGGVAGITPCEVTIFGSGIAAQAAAASAAGIGATVRMFDDDTYGLRNAVMHSGSPIICSSLQPHVIRAAIATADIIIATPAAIPYELSAETLAHAKQGVLAYDITDSDVSPFRTFIDTDIAATDSDTTSADRRCYRNLSAAVPRTTAMALSNAIVTLLPDIIGTSNLGIASSLGTPNSGIDIRHALYTHMGHVTDPDLARIHSLPYLDIDILARLS